MFIASFCATTSFTISAFLALLAGDYLNGTLLCLLAVTWSAIAQHQWRHRITQ